MTKSTTPTAKDGTRYRIEGVGAAVVLVHGFGMNLRMWQWQSGSLAARYRTITYDLYGHGESPMAPDRPSLSLFSRQLLGLLDELQIDQAAIVGFSLGGMIARRFAMDHGERLWALAILNSAHRRDSHARRAVQARVEEARREGPGATVEAALERWFTQAQRRDHPEMMDLVRSWILANDRVVYSGIYQVLVDGVDELIGGGSAIRCPTLVMTAEEDFGNSPEMARAMAAEIPGARSVIIPRLRHMALAERPDLYSEALMDFLQGAEGALANRRP